LAQVQVDTPTLVAQLSIEKLRLTFFFSSLVKKERSFQAHFG